MAVPETDEHSGLGYPFDGLVVVVTANPERLSIDQLAAARGVSGFASVLGAPITSATLDGRPALASSYMGIYGEQRSEVALVAGDRAYVVSFYVAPSCNAGTCVPSADRTNVPAMMAIARSFHVLSEPERATAPTATPSPSRSAESVADALAAGFARNDLTVLADQLGACVWQGRGPERRPYMSEAASLEAAAAYVEDLRRDFAAGLAVTVTARPVLDYGGTDARYIRSVWTRPGKAAESVDLMLRANGAHWYWASTQVRPPGS